MKKPEEVDQQISRSGLLIGSEPLEAVRHRRTLGKTDDDSDKDDSDAGDDDATDSDGTDSDLTDKADKGDTRDADGKD